MPPLQASVSVLVSNAQSEGQKAVVTAKEAAAIAVEDVRKGAAQQAANIRAQLDSDSQRLRLDYTARRAALISQVWPPFSAYSHFSANTSRALYLFCSMMPK